MPQESLAAPRPAIRRVLRRAGGPLGQVLESVLVGKQHRSAGKVGLGHETTYTEEIRKRSDRLMPGDVIQRELDLRGRLCPGPTGDTLQALKELSPGDRLTVILDYLPARQTLPRLLDERGHRWEITEDDGTTFYMNIEKGQDR